MQLERVEVKGRGHGEKGIRVKKKAPRKSREALRKCLFGEVRFSSRTVAHTSYRVHSGKPKEPDNNTAQRRKVQNLT
jgi:hypothetical protein